MRKDRLSVAVSPVGKFEVQRRETLGPRGPLCDRHFQVLGSGVPRAPDEGEKHRMGSPGEEGAGGFGSEDLRREKDGPALRLFDAARVIAYPEHLAGRDDVHVTSLYSPLSVDQP